MSVSPLGWKMNPHNFGLGQMFEQNGNNNDRYITKQREAKANKRRSELVVIGRRLSVLSVGLQELFQALQRSLSVVLCGLVVALLVELDGGEAPDARVRQLVGRGVDLGHDEVGSLLLGLLLGQLVPDGREGLAVAAPRRVELHQHVLLLVEGHRVEVLAREVLDW